jgi:hypothetical protein
LRSVCSKETSLDNDIVFLHLNLYRILPHIIMVFEIVSQKDKNMQSFYAIEKLVFYSENMRKFFRKWPENLFRNSKNFMN